LPSRKYWSPRAEYWSPLAYGLVALEAESMKGVVQFPLGVAHVVKKSGVA